MKFKQLFAATAALAVSASVFAGEITPFPERDNFKSSKTRAEVMAELNAAQQAGTYVAGGPASVDPAVYIGTIGNNAAKDSALASKKTQVGSGS